MSTRPRWCCRTGLNCRPLPYQGSALPLSYGSMESRKESAQESRHRPRFLPQAPRWRKHWRRPGRARSDPVPSLPHGDRDLIEPRPAERVGSPDTLRRIVWRIFQMTDQRRKGDDKDLRRDRLKAALRENLKRRKSHGKGREEITPSSNPDDVAAGETGKKHPGK